jgi:hypothetical protein
MSANIDRPAVKANKFHKAHMSAPASLAQPHLNWTSLPGAIVAAASAAARQWRLLLLWVLLSLLPAAILALPFLRLLGASFDYSMYAPALAKELDLVALADVANNYVRNGMSVPLAGLQAVILTLLLSPLLTGMVIAAGRAEQRLGFGALLAGGVQEYMRLARMLLVAVLPLGAAAAIGGMAGGMADRYNETAMTASSAAMASLIAAIVMAVLLVLAHATIDGGRAILALDRRRRSAFKAWWQGCKLLLRHPLRLLGAYIPITLVGLLLAAALTLGRLHMAGFDTPRFAAAFIVTQLIIAVLAWMRTARLFALMAVAREHGHH